MPTERQHYGEPTGVPPTTRAENTQSSTTTVTILIDKSELMLRQGAADAFTQAGLGTYRYTVAEQINPITRNPIPDDSSDIAVEFTSGGDGFRLWRVVERARALPLAGRLERTTTWCSDEAEATVGNLHMGVVKAPLCNGYHANLLLLYDGHNGQVIDHV